MTTYAEFRLRIEPGPRKGPTGSRPAGSAATRTGTFRVPFAGRELENFVLKVGRTQARGPPARVPGVGAREGVRGQLFAAVMQGPVRRALPLGVQEARAAGQGLRVTLSLTDVPELGGIPWEYLYDSPNFLSISTWTPVVRYLDLPKPRRALEVELPLRILGVVSAPTDYEALDGEAGEGQARGGAQAAEGCGRGHDRLARGGHPPGADQASCGPTRTTSSTSSATVGSTTERRRAPSSSRTRRAGPSGERRPARRRSSTTSSRCGLCS